MTPDQATRPAQEGRSERCGYCPVPVRWLDTYMQGHSLCFDARPRPAIDTYRTDGWIPGRFMIDGNLRTVYAPWPRHHSNHRRRAKQVYLLHQCSGLSGAVVA